MTEKHHRRESFRIILENVSARDRYANLQSVRGQDRGGQVAQMGINIGGHQRGPLTRFFSKRDERSKITGDYDCFRNKKNDLGVNKQTIASAGNLGAARNEIKDQ